jgi:hypothetical protein
MIIYPKTIILPHKSDNLLLGGRTYSILLERFGSTSSRLLLLSCKLSQFQMANLLLFPCLAKKYMFSFFTWLSRSQLADKSEIRYKSSPRISLLQQNSVCKFRLFSNSKKTPTNNAQCALWPFLRHGAWLQSASYL